MMSRSRQSGPAWRLAAPLYRYCAHYVDRFCYASEGDAINAKHMAMTVRISICSAVVVTLMVAFGIGVMGSASSLALQPGHLVSHPERAAARQQCHAVEHGKGEHAKGVRCAPSRHHKAARVHCPVCAGGCPALKLPAAASPGPTSFAGGIEVIGGPPSSPESCAHWGAGEVHVANAAGENVTTQKVAAGETYDIPVSPGIYLLTVVNNYGFRCESGPVTAVADEKTRAIVRCNIK